MDYNTYTPGETMRRFLKCFWTLDSAATTPAEKQRIVPDGCMEMIFHYGDLYKQFAADGTCIIQPRCFVFGQVTIPLEIEPTGSTGIFAARFHPDGFTPFSIMPPREMENKAIALSLLFGDKARPLEKAVLGAATAGERIQIVEFFLLEQLHLPETIDPVTQSSVALMIRQNGQLSVEELSEQLQVNRRQLERRFSSTIGLSPKQLAKIIRLQATLKMLEKKQFTSLTSLAYENGYFDQTHFIKDFKEFTGMSPKQFYAGNLKMSALFIGSD